ncbi:MAG TPA: cold shock domain-containing protein [Stellaceae bacterium]|jgi:CspA family cold shock protein|nr:cold shock domain-containing protein [Stellaceae bacterium]
MSRGNQFREPRRRGFEDDFAPSHGRRDGPPSRGFGGGGAGGGGGGHTPSTPSGPAVEAKVKWFNPEKGFGFVELSEGGSDAFLHINALHAAGADTVAPGSTLRVHVGQGMKGAQVTSVVSIDASTATPDQGGGGHGGGGGFGSPRPPRSGSRGGGHQVDPSNAVDAVGMVKWFNSEKGFGFVACNDGLKDVFIHISVLNAAGISHLAEGQQVSMRIVETPKGREAVSVSLND